MPSWLILNVRQNRYSVRWTRWQDLGPTYFYVLGVPVGCATAPLLYVAYLHLTIRSYVVSLALIVLGSVAARLAWVLLSEGRARAKRNEPYRDRKKA
jgi:hypothetical protein